MENESRNMATPTQSSERRHGHRDRHLRSFSLSRLNETEPHSLDESYDDEGDDDDEEIGSLINGSKESVHGHRHGHGQEEAMKRGGGGDYGFWKRFIQVPLVPGLRFNLGMSIHLLLLDLLLGIPFSFLTTHLNRQIITYLGYEKFFRTPSGLLTQRVLFVGINIILVLNWAWQLEIEERARWRVRLMERGEREIEELDELIGYLEGEQVRIDGVLGLEAGEQLRRESATSTAVTGSGVKLGEEGSEMASKSYGNRVTVQSPSLLLKPIIPTDLKETNFSYSLGKVSNRRMRRNPTRARGRAAERFGKSGDRNRHADDDDGSYWEGEDGLDDDRDDDDYDDDDDNQKVRTLGKASVGKKMKVKKMKVKKRVLKRGRKGKVSVNEVEEDEDSGWD